MSKYYNKDNVPLKVVISYYSGPGAGGQKKNKTNVGVQLLHEPTGIIVRNEDTRSIHKNKNAALKEMAARLEKHYSRLNKELYREEFKPNNERVRTYNQKRGFCTDHKTGISVPINKNNCCPEVKNLVLLVNSYKNTGEM
jgi:peptide chain release factor 1